MAHALVFWKDSLDVDVIETTSIVRDSQLGLCGCWEGKLYPIKVLKKHDNATWLNGHVVNTNGMIVSEPPAPRKLPGQQKPADAQAIRRKIDGPVVYQSSIFGKKHEEEEEEEDETTGDESPNSDFSGSDSEDSEREKKEARKKIYSRETTSGKIPIPPQKECATSTGGKSHRGKTNSCTNDTAGDDQLRDDGEFATFEDASSKSEPCGTCGNFPTITEEAMNCLENIFDYVKERYVSQGTTSRQPVFVDKTRLHKVEVLKGSGIWMASVFLEIVASRYKKNPKEMTRQLLKRMYSPEELPKMAVDELPGRKKIPDHVYETIEGFVFRNTLERHRLGAAAFKHCVTATVCTARTNERKKDGVRDDKPKRPAKPNDPVESAGFSTERGKFGPSTRRKNSKIDEERETIEPTSVPTKPNTRSTGKSIQRNLKSVEEEGLSTGHTIAKNRKTHQTSKSEENDPDKKLAATHPRKPTIIDISENLCNMKKNREGDFVYHQKRADSTKEVKTAQVGSRSKVRIDLEDFGDDPSGVGTEERKKNRLKKSKKIKRSLFSESDSEEEGKAKRMKFNTHKRGLKHHDGEREDPNTERDAFVRENYSTTPIHDPFDENDDFDYFN